MIFIEPAVESAYRKRAQFIRLGCQMLKPDVEIRLVPRYGNITFSNRLLRSLSM